MQFIVCIDQKLCVLIFLAVSIVGSIHIGSSRTSWRKFASTNSDCPLSNDPAMSIKFWNSFTSSPNFPWTLHLSSFSFWNSLITASFSFSISFIRSSSNSNSFLCSSLTSFKFFWASVLHFCFISSTASFSCSCSFSFRIFSSSYSVKTKKRMLNFHINI